MFFLMGFLIGLGLGVLDIKLLVKIADSAVLIDKNPPKTKFSINAFLTAFLPFPLLAVLILIDKFLMLGAAIGIVLCINIFFILRIKNRNN